jgi:hypothetical protein
MINDPTQELDVSEAPRSNGQTPASVSPTRSSLPVAGRREQTFALPGDSQYRGYQFKAWVNYPGNLGDQIGAESPNVRNKALSQVVLWHNGWPDIDGNELPQWEPGDAEAFGVFWDAIPQELRAAVYTFVGIEVGNLSTGIQERRMNRRR